MSLQEELKAEALIEKLENEKKKRFEFELNQYRQRAQELEDELNVNIDKGDSQYTMLKDEIKFQEETEMSLSQNLNDLANRSNILLRSKLNQNKSDFERLRHLGSSDGAVGADLEKRVADADQMKLEIAATLKGAHKGLINIRDVMKCDIGKDQKPYKPDLKQVDHMCQLIGEKDAELYVSLMPAKDKVEREYLANQVSNGLRDIMNGDKVDIEQHINFNNSGMEKLNKMTEKHKQLQQKQDQNFQEQDKTLAGMKEQIGILNDEKQVTLDEIAKNKRELDNLYGQLNSKKQVMEKKDEKISHLEGQIDDKFNQMEALEDDVEQKNLVIKDLENELAILLNKKVEPVAPKYQHYVPIKGDSVDERLADYINEYGSPVPWKRISEGNYTYGSKKVNVKYMRMHLIVKVGGGSMMVEEFVANYEDIELAKINHGNPGSGVPANPSQAGLTKQQRVAMARGASPRNAGIMGSPKANRSNVI